MSVVACCMDRRDGSESDRKCPRKPCRLASREEECCDAKKGGRECRREKKLVGKARDQEKQKRRPNRSSESRRIGGYMHLHLTPHVSRRREKCRGMPERTRMRKELTIARLLDLPLHTLHTYLSELHFSSRVQQRRI